MLGDEDNGEPKGDVVNYALMDSNSNAHVSSSYKVTKFDDFEPSYFEQACSNSVDEGYE